MLSVLEPLSGFQIAHVAIIVLCAVPLAYVDVRSQRLPNIGVAVLFGSLAAVIGWEACVVERRGELLVRSTAGALGMAGIYCLLALFGRRANSAALGGGDIKLSFALGLAAAAQGFDPWLMALLLPFVGGGLHGIGVRLWARARRRSPPSDIAFGPWMLAGTLVALL